MKKLVFGAVALAIVIIGLVFLADPADEDSATTAAAATAQPDPDIPAEPTLTSEPVLVVPGSNTDNPVSYLKSTRAAAEAWKAERGYLDPEADSASLQFQYETYDDETLQSLSESGDGLASIVLAERLEVREGQRDRVKELYFAAAIDGKTAALNELATFQLNPNAFGDSPIARVDENGDVTDEYIEQLAYFAAAELAMDPIASMLLDFNIRAEHRQQVMDRMADVCANARSLLEKVQAEREAQGREPLKYEFDPNVFPVTDVTWHCQKQRTDGKSL